MSKMTDIAGFRLVKEANEQFLRYDRCTIWPPKLGSFLGIYSDMFTAAADKNMIFPYMILSQELSTRMASSADDIAEILARPDIKKTLEKRKSMILEILFPYFDNKRKYITLNIELREDSSHQVPIYLSKLGRECHDYSKSLTKLLAPAYNSVKVKTYDSAGHSPKEYILPFGKIISSVFESGWRRYQVFDFSPCNTNLGMMLDIRNTSGKDFSTKEKAEEFLLQYPSTETVIIADSTKALPFHETIEPIIIDKFCTMLQYEHPDMDMFSLNRFNPSYHKQNISGK